jgi:hypothetical protein
MSNPLEICNGALQKIGAGRIMSLSTESKEARVCNSEYDKCRRTLLRLYPWGFASDRVILAPDAATPAFEFGYKHPLPSDYLRVVELWNYDGKHKVEGRFILADADTLYLKYIKDVSDLTGAESLFCDCLEWWLGYTIARYLTESETVREECFRGFKAVMPMAKFVQSTENSQPTFESTELIDSRFGSGRFVRDPLT